MLLTYDRVTEEEVVRWQESTASILDMRKNQ